MMWLGVARTRGIRSTAQVRFARGFSVAMAAVASSVLAGVLVLGAVDLLS